MSQISHDNHFVSQLYLKYWSEDGHNIWSYRTLVSHQRVPEWELRSIRGVAFHRDLYTTVIDDQEIDEFERWIKSEYEDPAQDALAKVLRDEKMGYARPGRGNQPRQLTNKGRALFRALAE